jgi:tRNA dimethylallyltransferase
MDRPPSGDFSAYRPIGVVGPTAVGKSAVALALAERIGGEIVSVDSMQVYRHLDIGTAKPSVEERERIPHHLIDVVEMTTPFDAVQFVQLATKAVRQIQQRRRIPILCGGTGLYLQAFLAGLGSAPPPDPRLRAELESVPLSALLAELEVADRTTFNRIDSRNPRRVLRAVEVIRLTGRPFSEQQACWSQTRQEDAIKGGPIFGIARVTEDLRRRIDIRVEGMFLAGLVDETREAVQRGLCSNPNASQAIGYRQVLEHLRGERELAPTVALVKNRTWQYARRQMTWFRNQGNVTWLHVEADERMDRVIERLFEAWPEATRPRDAVGGDGEKNTG